MQIQPAEPEVSLESSGVSCHEIEEVTPKAGLVAVTQGLPRKVGAFTASPGLWLEASAQASCGSICVWWVE